LFREQDEGEDEDEGSTVASSLVGPALVAVLALDVEQLLEQAADPACSPEERARLLRQLRTELEHPLEESVQRLLGDVDKGVTSADRFYGDVLAEYYWREACSLGMGRS